VTDADILKAADDAAVQASKMALDDLKKSIAGSLNEAVGAMKKQIREELMKDMPNEKEPLYKTIMSTAKAKRLMDIINKTVNSIGATGG
jgi:siroheme synthase (precorrin-2 oxidase/ferrochelatase)